MDLQTRIPDHIQSLLRRKDRGTRIAVVGASANPEKYGNIIVKNLSAKGYEVLPVNPREKVIEGLTVYKDVASVPRPIHLVNFVTPPAVTLSVLQEIASQGIEAVWFQEGSDDEKVLEYAKAHFPTVIHGACIMVVTSWL